MLQPSQNPFFEYSVPSTVTFLFLCSCVILCTITTNLHPEGLKQQPSTNKVIAHHLHSTICVLVSVSCFGDVPRRAVLGRQRVGVFVMVFTERETDGCWFVSALFYLFASVFFAVTSCHARATAYLSSLGLTEQDMARSSSHVSYREQVACVVLTCVTRGEIYPASNQQGVGGPGSGWSVSLVQATQVTV
ncbi:hypothetical protein F5B19DRAFT_331736 [Rostrohypoxylon terebratum]|nr:hypothetical protein F5B19DRAFT_331736 [Rostrohypoxylon terebratum]